MAKVIRMQASAETNRVLADLQAWCQTDRGRASLAAWRETWQPCDANGDPVPEDAPAPYVIIGQLPRA